jgi:uncharacterized protein YhjY with autotransporter beta-barrel domain/V8-like Glu-specific endopeptidase
MKHSKFLTGVGIVALSGALAASPAYASGGGSGSAAADAPSERTQWRLDQAEARAEETASPSITAPVATAPTAIVDNFAGIQADTYTATLDPSIIRPLPRFTGDISATTVRPTPRIISRDDVGLDGAVDIDNTQPSVVQIFSQNNATGGVFFNCTGSVINPRTILTAAHCLNARSSEAYGLAETGAERTQLISTGVDSSGRFFEYLGTGANYTEGGVASSTDVIIHPSSNLDNGGLPFPWADVALIAVDTPITDVPSLPILLTPLTELTHVVQVGYGSFGTADSALFSSLPIGFLRRVGENMLGAIASPADLIDTIAPDFAPTAVIFGEVSQPYYFTDFDNPDRVGPGEDRCTFAGNGAISCESLDAVLSIDWFDGDALPNEVATAGGDSGSPLIADQLGVPGGVITAVLSGGYDFFGVGNTYGDISFYNPLYPFFEFLTQNTAYKYVSARRGDGNWSDPTHWTQDLDPGFLVDDGTGNLVNGIPTGDEPGVFETGPGLGLILGNDVSEYPSDLSSSLPPEGTPDFGGNIPESSVLLGPGSRGFVPQNTDGTPGTAFENPAQYFEVHLSRRGTTTVDLDVEIDRLVIDHRRAAFVLPDEWSFTSLIGVEQFNGVAEINGTLNTGIYTLAGGELVGDGGTINTNVLFNLEGLLSAGGANSFGSLSIDGDYVQTSGGTLWSDFSVGRRNIVTADSYDISGVAVLDGDLVISSRDRRVRFGAEYTLLSAGSIDGDFASVTFLSRSPILAAEHRIEGNDIIVEVTARSIRDLLGRGSSMRSLGTALDTLRASRFDSFAEMFAVVDSASFDTLGSTLSSLTPISAFSQTFTANTFSQRFTGQIAQRTLALRGGSRAAGGFSAAGNASFALTGTTPAQTGGLGIYGSASGVYLNGGQQSGVLGNGITGFNTFGTNGVTSGVVGANAFEQASLTQAGEMTIGADLQVSEGFSFGVAVSNIRNSQQSTGALQAQEDTSQSVAIYATWSDGGLFADGYAGTSSQEFGVERAAQGDFRASYDNAIGQSDGEQTFGGMRLGYAFDLGQGFEVGPVVSMDYVRNSIGGYDEIGANAFGLSVADRTFTSMGAKAGAMASFDIRTGDTSSIRAFGSVAYARELADTADVVTANFFGAADTPFTIANQLDPQWVSVNAGAEMSVGQNLSASVSVTSDMGRGALSNDQGRVSLSWRF